MKSVAFNASEYTKYSSALLVATSSASMPFTLTVKFLFASLTRYKTLTVLEMLSVAEATLLFASVFVTDLNNSLGVASVVASYVIHVRLSVASSVKL